MPYCAVTYRYTAVDVRPTIVRTRTRHVEDDERRRSRPYGEAMSGCESCNYSALNYCCIFFSLEIRVNKAQAEDHIPTMEDSRSFGDLERQQEGTDADCPVTNDIENTSHRLDSSE
jgi:hypothetical protein